MAIIPDDGQTNKSELIPNVALAEWQSISFKSIRSIGFNLIINERK